MIDSSSTTISTILSAVGSFVTSAITWIGDFASTVTDTPLLLAFVIVSLVGIGVGLLRRLIRL